jgi:hypothetical protein
LTGVTIGYTEVMARGWESKSVEEQISGHQSEPQNSAKTKISRRDIEKKSKREGILLARSRTASILESTRDDRYRALLQRTLDHLDAELGKLELV